jgi:PncC family amidohydrolase
VNRRSQSLVKTVHGLLEKKGLVISAAESCTGGLLSYWLTFFPGSSRFFRAGVVAYSDDTKTNLLGVPAATLKRYGAVSAQTASAMARGIKKIFSSGAGIFVSTTGNLGPDVLEGPYRRTGGPKIGSRRKRGLVYIAVGFKGKTFVKELKLRGGREQNRARAAEETLKLLIRVLRKEVFS